MGQQAFDRDVGATFMRLLEIEPRQQIADWIVQPQSSLISELHCSNSSEQLRDRTDAVDSLVGRLSAAFDVGIAGGATPQQLLVANDGG